MAQNANRMSELNRRRVLQGLGAVGAASVAGCFSGDGGGGGSVDPNLERVEVDPADIQEGGTLTVGALTTPDSWDWVQSTSAHASVVNDIFYESLLANDSTGEIYPWLSESYELVETQDVSPADYESYMREAPIARPDEGPPTIDVDSQIVVRHPDNNLAEDDTAMVLTVDEVDAAIDDGTFGMHFHHELREGIEFHNGEEFTSEHVVRSYERFEGSNNSAQVFAQFLGAQPDGDYAVDLYAIQPDAEAVDDIIWPVFPLEYVDLPLGEWTPLEGNPPTGTGPWVFEDYEEGSSITVSRNENYWVEEKGLDTFDWWDGPEDFPASPPIETVEYRIVPEDSQRAGALDEGELDLTYRLPTQQKTNFHESDDFRMAATNGGSFLFAQYPVAVEPFDNQNVRRAINYLIPRTDIVENVTNGWTQEAWAPLPELGAEAGTTDYDALLENLRPMNERSVEEADQLLEEADVETPVDVTWVTNSDDQTRVTKAETIVESLNQSDNIDASLETPSDLNSLFATMTGSEWHLEGKIAMIGLSGTFNPHSFCEAPMHPSAFNQCCNVNIPPGSFPELMEQMDSCQYGVDVAEDPQLRRERYDELWQQIVEQSPASFVDFAYQTAALTNDLKGYNMYPFVTSLVDYGLWDPTDQQVAYLDR